MIGRTFGRLVVLERGLNAPGSTVPRWKCKCECGKVVLVTGGNLRNKRKPTKSCGCLKRDNPSRLRHGFTRTSAYRSWQGMRQRCHNQKNPVYRLYGARGITVCARWRTSFKNFLADMGVKPSGKRVSIERLKNSKGYSPSNCIWATQAIQCNNMRTNRCITYRGKRHSLAEWNRILGFPAGRLSNRLSQLGWTVEEALSTKVGEKRNGAKS
jgi:hypothetical protein